jgi:hypothetical protein
MRSSADALLALLHDDSVAYPAEQVDDGLQPLPVEAPCQGEAVVDPLLQGLQPTDCGTAHGSGFGGLPCNGRLRFVPGPVPLRPQHLAELALDVEEEALDPVGDFLLAGVVLEPAGEDALVAGGLDETRVLLEGRLEVAADAPACLPLE